MIFWSLSCPPTSPVPNSSVPPTIENSLILFPDESFVALLTTSAPVIKSVLTDPQIIFTAVVCVILMNFASFVARYRKKLPKKQVKKLYRQTQEKSSGSGENSDGTNESGGDSV